MNKRFTSLMFFIFTMIFFYVPLLVLIVYSFNDGKNILWKGFSIKWYKELFLYSSEIWRAFRYSILIAALSGIISTIIGTMGAIGLQWYNFPGKKLIRSLMYVPLIIPEVIQGVSLLIMFSTIKFKLGLTTIFVAHTTFNIPYVLFILMARLEEFDYNIVEAAYDLGATEGQTMCKIVIPALLPGIISGFLMSVTLSFDDFVTTFFVSGPGSTTLPLRIFSMVKLGVNPAINALSVLIIGIALVLTFSTKKFQRHFIH